jgi:hypothetical protein
MKENSYRHGFFDIDDDDEYFKWIDLKKPIYQDSPLKSSTSKKPTTDEILDSINIVDIERYLRKKKIERINEVRKTLNK